MSHDKSSKKEKIMLSVVSGILVIGGFIIITVESNITLAAGALGLVFGNNIILDLKSRGNNE